ncbi:MAG: HAMP domain-containing histidine kinase [Oscillospiraceae bacterium]|nr:HAMP domain-containing histidine kinase [Oscillospiraceae bacterium]
MKRRGGYAGFLRGVHRYLLFFAMTAFLVTCCMLLFLNILTDTLHITFTDENIGMAAKLTFGNVVLLSLLFTVIDILRRRRAVHRPVNRILQAADRLIAGDFSVRIAPPDFSGADGCFDDIADCFNRLAQELGSVETLRTDFIANVSHEMKTPLAVIHNYGTLLQQPGLSEETRMEYAGVITQSSRRLADMVTNILKLNRLENQQIYPQATEYDLGEQLRECLLQYEDIWDAAGIEPVTDIVDGVRIKADAELLALVWNNLLSNAFKFTESGGVVSVSLRADDTYATVRVKDTGCGMTPEVGARIFEKFYQGDASRAVQGNGLGLALVKRVVDILQGTISVESASGVGTVFTVRLRRRPHE